MPRAGRLEAAALLDARRQAEAAVGTRLEDKGFLSGGRASEIQNLTSEIRNLAAQTGADEI